MSLKRFVWVFSVLLAGSVMAAPQQPEAWKLRGQKFIDEYEKTIKPIEKEVGLLWWTANITGKDEDFEKKGKAEKKLNEKLSHTKSYLELKSLLNDAPKVLGLDLKDTHRQVYLLYLEYMDKQVDSGLLDRMTEIGNKVEQGFNVFRAKVDGKELTDSEVRKVLSESKDSDQRRKVWEASKEVGATVVANLKELVKLRNESAKILGFKNYHDMALTLSEQEPEKIMALFDELDHLTKKPFEKAKAEFDGILAKQYQVSVTQLMPWHYHDPFFQEPPSVFESNFDEVYAKQDIMKLSRDFYAGIGLPIDDVLAHSDLYEKPGKSPHAFCTDIDREGDVRVLANVVPNERWMGTMLHELGHAVYSSKNIPRDVPYVLRGEAHILTTEGVAMLFGQFSKNVHWLKQMGVKLSNPKAFQNAGERLRKYELLVFSRWCQVMLRFERAMYENPDQDLNALWWQLVSKYQGLKMPPGRNAPDFASKIHMVSAPAYYHNYAMGELFAAQVHASIAKSVEKQKDIRRSVFVGNPKVGEFFKEKIFAPARRLSWNDLTRYATGEDLNPKAFAKRF